MTTTVERPVKAAKGAKPQKARQASLLGGPVQVNLLPPEVQAKRALKHTKKWLLAIVVLALLAVAGVTALAVMAQSNADEELAFQQSETQRLLLEQQQYAEVPIILNQLETLKTAREMGMSTEVFWRPRLAALAATAPEGVTIEQITVAAPGPMVPPALPADPLQAQSVATITFTANSLTMPDTAAWIDALNTVPGYADAWFSSASITEKEEVAYYTVAGSVQVSADAQELRFVESETEGEG